MRKDEANLEDWAAYQGPHVVNSHAASNSTRTRALAEVAPLRYVLWGRSTLEPVSELLGSDEIEQMILCPTLVRTQQSLVLGQVRSVEESFFPVREYRISGPGRPATACGD